MKEDPNTVFFNEESQTKLVVPQYPCIVDAAERYYFKHHVSFAFQKGSPYVQLFNEKILLMKQSGTVEKIQGRRGSRRGFTRRSTVGGADRGSECGDHNNPNKGESPKGILHQQERR